MIHALNEHISSNHKGKNLDMQENATLKKAMKPSKNQIQWKMGVAVLLSAAMPF